MDHLATNIRNFRKEKGLTIKELAAKAQISQPALTNIELGKQDPTWGVIKKISSALDIPVPELVRSPESMQFDHKLISIITIASGTDNESWILTGTSQNTQGVEVKWGYLVVDKKATVEIVDNIHFESTGNTQNPTDFFKNHLQLFILTQRLKIQITSFNFNEGFKELEERGVPWNSFIKFIEHSSKQSHI